MRPLGYLSIWATGLFIAYAASCILLYAWEWSVRSGILQSAFLEDFRGHTIDTYFAYGAWIGFAIYAVNGAWFFCASQKAINRTDRTIGISPGWGLAYFYIPFVNLWGPFLAIRQLWNLSVRSESPVDAPAPGFFWPWWLAWLSALALDKESARIAAMDDWEAAYPDYLVIEVLISLSLAVAAVYFLRIQRGVIQSQGS